jgi:hypothetical protein
MISETERKFKHMEKKYEKQIQRLTHEISKFRKAPAEDS